MLNHYILLPLDEKHSCLDVLSLQKINELKIKVVFTKNFILYPFNEAHMAPLGNENIKTSKIDFLHKKQISPLSLNQLALIDFENMASLHLVGTVAEADFIEYILKKAEILDKITFLFTDISLCEDPYNLWDMFHNGSYQDNFREKLKIYADHILKQNKNFRNYEGKKIKFYGDFCFTPQNFQQFTLFIGDEKIITTEFIKDDLKKIKKRKLQKLKNHPYLFFKDFLKNKLKRLKR